MVSRVKQSYHIYHSFPTLVEVTDDTDLCDTLPGVVFLLQRVTTSLLPT